MLRSQAIRELNKIHDSRGKHPNGLKNLRAPSNWNNLPTVAIRIPEVFKARILKYAKELDGSELISSDEIGAVKERLQELLVMKLRPSQSSDTLKAAIQEIVDFLD